MSRSENLTYSNDLCSAFMAAIVRSFEKHVGAQHYLGRTAMQKLVYFAKVLGVPIPCSFEIYTYGPYSDTVTFSVDSLLADDVLTDASKARATYSNYRLGPNATEILNQYHDAIEPYQGTVDDVVRNLGSFQPQDLELIATLHFIHGRLKQIRLRVPERDEVIQEFKRIKGEKFSRQQIDSFYGALVDAGLIPNTVRTPKPN